ncbi:hypothetical protein BKA82DRAFT_942408 [Pisolithus tinctorius]|uniref:Uncharacterized protein n=1 Tax=Pisolithus tinctorius Marx 270 TaxID=870435 RepID=A0A0C3JD83_PISTI|nr:hypothetical protein BKA82DRAFT_942408 [Pisolithus tinctorius]KIO07038.1 hypothetical protein M404DRAFT_942408 [Pisolithus tinctorius Marx 270]
MSDHYITTESRENKRPRTPSHSGTSRAPKRPQPPALNHEPSAPPDTMTLPPPVESSPQPAVPPPLLPNTTPPVVLTEPLLPTPQAQIAVPATEITPRPPNGFPVPQLCDQVTRGLDETLLTAWSNKPGPKAWIRPWRAKFEPDAEATWSKLKTLVQRVIGQEASTTLVISTPQEDGTFTTERSPPPWHFLVSGLSQDATTFLVNLQVISTPEITAFTLPFVQPTPTYICTLENFTLPDSPESNTIVASVVKQAIQSDDVIPEFIRGLDPDPDVLPTLINSIHVTSLRIANNITRKQTLWNVYCSYNPAFMTLDKHFLWRCLIRNLRFRSEDHGMGVVRLGEKQFRCVGCKSLDHPTGLCPFPSIPGWLGPKPQLTDSIPNQIAPTPRPIRGRNATRGGRGTPRGRAPRGGHRY